MLPYEERITKNKEEFFAKLQEICAKLGIKPEWLMVCMCIESAGTFDPSIVNPSTGATGLIQFMPSTAKSLGTTCEALAKLKNYEQLEYVYKYFRPWTGRMTSFVDVYLVIFYPAAVGKDDDYMFGMNLAMQNRIAKVNPSYDINKDGIITKGEVETIISKFIPKAYAGKI